MPPAVLFEDVSKKFRRGERDDTLRKVVPSLLGRLISGGPRPSPDPQEFWALRQVSFEIEPGKALGIIGPNGSGKSTTLKILAKIVKPTSGRAAVRGRVGLLIETAAGFHPDLTGRENVYLQGAVMGMKRDAIAGAFDAIVEFAGVSDFIDTPVKRYSSGMHARLGFAIAAHLAPDVLVIDEVLSVGDARFQERCMERLRALRTQGVTLVFVSHNLPAITALCDRALLLCRGRVVCLGDPREVTARYLSAPADQLNKP